MQFLFYSEKEKKGIDWVVISFWYKSEYQKQKLKCISGLEKKRKYYRFVRTVRFYRLESKELMKLISLEKNAGIRKEF